MSIEIPAAIETLFDQYFNQTITPEGLAQLEAWLGESPDHAQAFAKAGMAHGLTREVMRAQVKHQANLRPKILRFAKPVLLAASLALVVGVGFVVYQRNMRVYSTGHGKMVAMVDEEINADVEHGSIDRLPGPISGEIGPMGDGAPPAPAATLVPSLAFGGEHGRERKGVFSTSGQSSKVRLRSDQLKTGTTVVSGVIPPNDIITYPTDWPKLTGKDSTSPDPRLTDTDGNGNYEGQKVFPSDTILPDGLIDPHLGTSLPIEAAPPSPSRDQYAQTYDNKFTSPLAQPLSTFSVDVDTAAYANTRRFINEGRLPPPEAVRIEELLNYFSYDYAPPRVLKVGEAIGENPPFAVHTEECVCPWNPTHRLLRIGIKGASVDMGQRPTAHLTFLLDVSGSMDSPDKLPLAKQGLIRLLAQLRPDDHVSLVVYAGASGCVLENASCANKAQILGAIDRLGAGGSTAGAQGINQAYDLAQKHFVKGGVNRVILCTDGDFNVGISDTNALIQLAKEKANPKNGEGVYLSTCGFGRGNLNDHMMEQIADAGNGNYAYIDSLNEAEKVFVKQAGGTLVTIAKDVKLQLEFNPAKVGQYRLIGYENRMLKAEDFNDDTVDAGDIGAGHTVTALYEITPVGVDPQPEPKAEASAPDRSVDALTYQNERKVSDKAKEGDDLLTLKLRHKLPTAKAEKGTSKLQVFVVKDAAVPFEKAGADTHFAAAVAAYGMILRGSKYKGNATLGWVEKAARGAMDAKDLAVKAQRSEFVDLVRKAAQLKRD